MVTWIDYEHDKDRIPNPETPILMIVDYEVCIGYYDLKFGFLKLPFECKMSNIFNSKPVMPTFWAYMPKHPFEV